MSPDDLDKISHEDAANCWYLYQKGMAGPSIDYISSYNTYSSIHQLTESFRMANFKNYKPDNPAKFETVFSDQFNIIALRDKIGNKSAHSLGTQAAIAIIDSNAPAWLTEAVQEEIDGSTQPGNNH